MKKNIIFKIIIAVIIALSFSGCSKENIEYSSKKIDYEYRFKDQTGGYTRVIGCSNIEIREVSSNQQDQQYICKIHIENKDGKWLLLRAYGSIDNINERTNNLIDNFVKYNTEPRHDADGKPYIQFRNKGYNSLDLTTNISTNETIKFNDISVFKNYIQKMIEELI